ncbi:hypothetical protein [Vibrio phage vB_VhaS-a]|nr:hypothetical protein [Vibrio phage vB_VhaS-a]
MFYRDSRGDEWKLSDMKVAKLSNVYRSTKKKRKNLEGSKVDGEFKTLAHERQYKQLTTLENGLKQELMKRNPFDLQGILHGD